MTRVELLFCLGLLSAAVGVAYFNLAACALGLGAMTLAVLKEGS